MRRLMGSCGFLLVLVLVACGGGSDGPVATDAPTTSSTVTSTTTAPEATDAPTTTAPTGYDLSRFEGEWQQICEPYLPGDGASAGGFVYDQSGPDVLSVTLVGFRWGNTTCSGPPRERELYGTFEQRVVGVAEIDGVEVFLVEDGRGFRDVIGIDSDGRLRSGDIKGSVGEDGFPTAFEPVEKAATRR